MPRTAEYSCHQRILPHNRKKYISLKNNKWLLEDSSIDLFGGKTIDVYVCMCVREGGEGVSYLESTGNFKVFRRY